jgi:hypothetical protein
MIHKRLSVFIEVTSIIGRQTNFGGSVVGQSFCVENQATKVWNSGVDYSIVSSSGASLSCAVIIHANTLFWLAFSQGFLGVEQKVGGDINIASFVDA